LPSDESSQDLKLLHDKLDRTRAVDQANRTVKTEFIGERNKSGVSGSYKAVSSHFFFVAKYYTLPVVTTSTGTGTTDLFSFLKFKKKLKIFLRGIGTRHHTLARGMGLYPISVLAPEPPFFHRARGATKDQFWLYLQLPQF